MAEKTDKVLLRGMRKDFFVDHFQNMVIYFNKDRLPQYDSDFIGFYKGAPDSAVTHIGIVEKIERPANDDAIFYLKAIIKLDDPVSFKQEDGSLHGVSGHEYKSFEELGIRKLAIVFNNFSKVGGFN